jgi:hypothetical protein
MRASLTSLTAVGALVFGFTALIGQAPAPAPAAAPVPAAPTDPPAPFTAHVVASGLRGGYQVVAADMNKDGKTDLIGLGSSMPELLWYENPTWTPHVIVRGAPRMINLAAADADGDGIPEIGLAYEFGTTPANSLGKLAILKANGDPRELWTLTEIDAIPTSHRVRFASIDGQAVLINAPILGVKSRDGFNDPDRTPTALRAYRAPGWKPETVTEENLGVVHGLAIGDWDGDKRDDVITGGYVGVFAHTAARGGGPWTRTEIVKGDPAPWPGGGASDVAIGSMNKRRMLVTNEPFHGNQVVVYTEGPNGLQPRNIIDTRLNNSHSLTLVDVDGDGNHEIVSGGTRPPAGSGRGTKPGVFFYKAVDPQGQKWNRYVLDAGIAANSCVTADFNNDKRMDVACIDNTDPWSVRWYENTGK